MNRNIIFAAALALPLAACAGGAANTGVAVATAGANLASISLSPTDLAAMQSACQSAAPALSVATSSVVPAKLSAVAVYPASFCQQLNSGIPATANSNSPKWLAGVLAATQDAANIASVALPVALKLLPLVALL